MVEEINIFKKNYAQPPYFFLYKVRGIYFWNIIFVLQMTETFGHPLIFFLKEVRGSLFLNYISITTAKKSVKIPPRCPKGWRVFFSLSYAHWKLNIKIFKYVTPMTLTGKRHKEKRRDEVKAFSDKFLPLNYW